MNLSTNIVNIDTDRASMNSGDQHNFGRRTEFSIINGVDHYVKPRTVYWEWLFAGKDSPLAFVFRNDEKLNKYLGAQFSLDVTFAKETLPFEFSGHVRKVESCSLKELAAKNPKVVQNFYESFGAICAYAYCFGLNDLNFENILVCPDARLQLVDVETAFIRPKFLGSTSMTSDGSSALNYGCFSSKLKSLEVPVTDYLPYLLQAYTETLQALVQNGKAISSKLMEEMNAIQRIPFRSVFRHSRSYFMWLIEHGFFKQTFVDEIEKKAFQDLDSIPISFFQEEMEQLERGDVPYFFSYLNSKDIFYLKSAEGKKAKIESKEGLKYTEHMGRSEADLEWRFSKERLIDSCLPSGLVEILWDILPRDYMGQLGKGHLSVTANPETLRVDDDQNQRRYIAQRAYNVSNTNDFIQARTEIIVLPKSDNSLTQCMMCVRIEK